MYQRITEGVFFQKEKSQNSFKKQNHEKKGLASPQVTTVSPHGISCVNFQECGRMRPHSYDNRKKQGGPPKISATGRPV